MLFSVLGPNTTDQEAADGQLSLEEVDEVLDAVSVLSLQVVLTDSAA